jgi:hypothetical protein
MAESPYIKTKPEHRTASKSALEELYSQHGFDEKLAQCEQFILCDRPRKQEDTRHASIIEHEKGVKYCDPATKNSIAVIFIYRTALGTELRVIRMLRIGDLIYDAKIHPS